MSLTMVPRNSVESASFLDWIISAVARRPCGPAAQIRPWWSPNPAVTLPEQNLGRPSTRRSPNAIRPFSGNFGQSRFGGKPVKLLIDLSPKRDCGLKRVKRLC